MQLAIYQIGLMYAILKECRALSEFRQADRAIMSDVCIRLDQSFALSSEQKVWFNLYFIIHVLTILLYEMNIRLLAGEMLLDPNRVRYTQLSADVEVSVYHSNM
jgi:hypothetical protein